MGKAFTVIEESLDLTSAGSREYIIGAYWLGIVSYTGVAYVLRMIINLEDQVGDSDELVIMQPVIVKMTKRIKEVKISWQAAAGQQLQIWSSDTIDKMNLHGL